LFSQEVRERLSLKIADRSFAGHANQARVRRISIDDPESPALYSSDKNSFSHKSGLERSDDSSFSFSDVYDDAPLSLGHKPMRQNADQASVSTATVTDKSPGTPHLTSETSELDLAILL